MFKNESIESIEEWNALLLRGGGFALPVHPPARIDFKAKFVQWYACGWNLGKIQEGSGITDFDWPDDVPCPDRTLVYRKVTVTRETGEETLTATLTANPFAQYTSFGLPDDFESVGDYIPGPLVLSEIAMADPVTTGFVVDEADTKIGQSEWTGTYSDHALFDKTLFTCGGNPTSNPHYVRCRALRYRMGVPTGYDYPHFNVKWDEVFYPKAWLAWKPIKDAWDAWKVKHDAWKVADRETRGDEPTEPTKPDKEPDKPKLSKSREWTYSGDEHSPWFEIKRPSQEGEIHIRNVRTLSYRTPWGNAPHFQGARFKP